MIYVDYRKKATVFTVKFMLFLFLLVFAFIVISRLGYISAGTVMFPDYNQVYSPTIIKNQKKVIVIDPGHGGADNGASGLNNTNEKELNLIVSKMVGEILSMLDFDVHFTRTEDISPGNTEKFIKKNDLVFRTEFAKKFDDPIFVSIHMNKFGVEKYSGTQVFYSKNNPLSEAMAIKVQKAVRLLLQPSNTREVKKVPSTIFILNRLECPAILIECGFLSNDNESKLLTQSDYQKKLAFCIAMGIADCYKNN